MTVAIDVSRIYASLKANKHIAHKIGSKYFVANV